MTEVTAPPNTTLAHLQNALDSKQHELQALRLRCGFASVHQIELEAQQKLASAVSLQRRISAQSTSVSKPLQLLLSRCNNARDAAAAAQAKAEDTQAANTWKALLENSALQQEVPKNMVKLQEEMKAAIKTANASTGELDQIAEAKANREEGRLTRELEARKAVLQRQVLAAKESARKGVTADEGVSKDALAALRDEVERLREEKAALAL